jgi:hypothetical protein
MEEEVVGEGADPVFRGRSARRDHSVVVRRLSHGGRAQKRFVEQLVCMEASVGKKIKN